MSTRHLDRFRPAAPTALGALKFDAGYQYPGAPESSDAGYCGSATPTARLGGVSLPTAVDPVWLGVTGR
ncbi:hypothetical protein BZM27_52645 [Paraburkholderia steynii]|uniref:Uncharacterized protein n=1 Tax=Paraburkholderia steynii TaxID=1245441 RepID=A0A4R0X7R2_9BURK|nr:hypothetical protein BZM27_52645 [Paraburkholderia steynii]